MKINLFYVPQGNIRAMKEKFALAGLKPISKSEPSEWRGVFYFSEEEPPSSIPWVATYSDFFGDRQPANLIYFAAYILEKGTHCFALTYGKSHFYVRPFCDHDFGIEVAKRVADDSHIRQTSSKRFAGSRKKEIRSFASNTPLNVESGESVDYLQAPIISELREAFGSAAKFGSSVLLNPPVEKEELGEILDSVVSVLKCEPRFALPRTTVVDDEVGIARYDGMLIEAITTQRGIAEFSHEGHDVVGVDFVFSGNERYTLSCRGHSRWELHDNPLNMDTLRTYIANEGISVNQLFDIRVGVDNEGQKSYSKQLKQSLDFVVDDENVMLTQGRWVRFNEDYLDQLNTYVDNIAVEDTEPNFERLVGTEGAFNDSDEVKALGYVVADKDFSVIRTRASTPVEAWDLRKGETVYAVKFGTAQKVGYVCDQAMAVLEIIRNRANLRKLDQDVKSYCLWFGLKRARQIDSLSKLNSIILKQKIEAWARRCRELGVEPKVKLSLHEKSPASS